MGVIAAAVSLSMALGLGFSFNVTRVIRQILSIMQEMAESSGDLTRRIRVRSKDEIGDLANAFNKMLENLKIMISTVYETAETVAVTSEELKNTPMQWPGTPIRWLCPADQLVGLKCSH